MIQVIDSSSSSGAKGGASQAKKESEWQEEVLETLNGHGWGLTVDVLV